MGAAAAVRALTCVKFLCLQKHRRGEFLAARRLQIGLTQQLLADLAGVSRYSVRWLEYRTGSVKLGSVVQIADVYLDRKVLGSPTRLPTDEIRLATPGLSIRQRSVSWSLLGYADYPVTATGGAVPPFFAGLRAEGVRSGLRERVTAAIIDAIVDAALSWPDRCAEIGFPTQQTAMLADMLRSRIATLA